MSLYAVGKITGCFAVRGYVKVRPYTHSVQRFSDLHEVFLGASANDSVRHIVEDVIYNNRTVLIKLGTVDDRTSAGQCVGKFLFVAEDDVRKAGEGLYFVHDIVGCEVSTTDGRILGVVEDVYRLPAQDIWVIRSGRKSQMVPAVKEFIKNVDTVHNKIIVKVIEGLIDE